jgi:hypothetical protein
MYKRLSTMLPGLLLLSTAACTDGGPTGAEEGKAAAEVRVHGDAPSGASESRSQSSSEATGEVEGSVDVQARVYLQTEAGHWVEVTNGAAAQTVEASGSDGFRLLASSEIEARSYHRVRLEFESVRGELSGGLALGIGGGSAIVHVETGSSGQVTVEREVDVAAHAGTTTRLDIDLNTAQWAGAASGTTGVVAESAFASAVSVTAH